MAVIPSCSAPMSAESSNTTGDSHEGLALARLHGTAAMSVANVPTTADRGRHRTPAKTPAPTRKIHRADLASLFRRDQEGRDQEGRGSERAAPLGRSAR